MKNQEALVFGNASLVFPARARFSYLIFLEAEQKKHHFRAVLSTVLLNYFSKAKFCPAGLCPV
jgi:hypothetical protein